MSDELTWWDRLCLRIGLCWDAPPEPAPVAGVPPVEPAPASEAETVGDVVERVMQHYRAAFLSLGTDTAWMLDPSYFTREKEALRALANATERLAVIVEIPRGSAAAVEWHFVEEAIFTNGFEAGIDFVVSGRGEIDADFFRLDGEWPEHVALRRVRDDGLPAFIVKKQNEGGGAPPPQMKR